MNEARVLDHAEKGRPMKSMDFECGIFCEETYMGKPI